MTRRAALTAIFTAALIAATACTGPDHPPTQPLPQQTNRATHTLLLFADFRCPHCARFAAVYQNRLLSELNAPIQSNQLAFEFRHLPVLGQKSAELAIAGECAQKQGRFQPFHDHLYAHQFRALQDARIPPIDGVGPSLAPILAISGIDTAAFNSCLNSPEPFRTVQAHITEAQALGVRGTPTITLDGHHLEWDNLDHLLSLIRNALSQTQSRSPPHDPNPREEQAPSRPP